MLSTRVIFPAALRQVFKGESVRASDPLEPELHTVELPWGCWESNIGLLEEQPELLALEPSLYPLQEFLERQPKDGKSGTLAGHSDERIGFGSRRLLP